MKKKCKLCTDKEECDDCFILRIDGLFHLDDTIRAIWNALSPQNRIKMDKMDYRRKQWLAIQAWAEDGLLKWGDKVQPRRTK